MVACGNGRCLGAARRKGMTGLRCVRRDGSSFASWARATSERADWASFESRLSGAEGGVWTLEDSEMNDRSLPSVEGGAGPRMEGTVKKPDDLVPP